MKSADRPSIMVSSAVYGIEPLLDQVFAALEGFGYRVWMSHKWTIPIHSRKSAFQNCLEAVERCDAFFGIITGRSHVFWLRGFIEDFGTGAARILAQCAQAGLPEPEWRIGGGGGGGGVRLTLRSSHAASAPTVELNPRQRTFLETARSGDRITVTEYSQRYARDISERQARNDLSQLATWGYLRREGRGPSTGYVRTGRRL